MKDLSDGERFRALSAWRIGEGGVLVVGDFDFWLVELDALGGEGGLDFGEAVGGFPAPEEAKGKEQHGQGENVGEAARMMRRRNRVLRDMRGV